jgi:hypothetical protein
MPIEKFHFTNLTELVQNIRAHKKKNITLLRL